MAGNYNIEAFAIDTWGAVAIFYNGRSEPLLSSADADPSPAWKRLKSLNGLLLAFLVQPLLVKHLERAILVMGEKV